MSKIKNLNRAGSKNSALYLSICGIFLAGLLVYAAGFMIMNHVWNPKMLSIADREIIQQRIHWRDRLDFFRNAAFRISVLVMLLYSCFVKNTFFQEIKKILLIELAGIAFVMISAYVFDPAFYGNYRIAAFFALCTILCQCLPACLIGWLRFGRV